MSFWLAPGGLHIGYGEPSDAAQLARIHAEGFFRGWSVSEFEAYLADPKSTPSYVAGDARRAISGFAMVRIVAPEAELLTIAVMRRMRGRGLGEALMRAVVDDLRRSPVKSLFLEVEEGNAPAIALYRAFGFETISVRKGYYPHPDGTVASALVMRTDLG